MDQSRFMPVQVVIQYGKIPVWLLSDIVITANNGNQDSLYGCITCDNEQNISIDAYFNFHSVFIKL